MVISASRVRTGRHRPLRHSQPLRHSRESGKPGAAEGRYSGVSPPHPAWIPAFAGMTIRGVVASLGWCFDTPAFQAVSKRQLRGAKGQSVIPVPLRHSRESGNPGVVEGRYNSVSPPHPAWIPAFAGMTIRGVVASLGWCFDTPAFQAVSKRQLRGAKGQSVIPVPLRHSRESGNPGVVEGRYNSVSPPHPTWIPAFAGMTIRGVVASLGWCFDTPTFAGMTDLGLFCYFIPMTASGATPVFRLGAGFRRCDGFGTSLPASDQYPGGECAM